MATNSSSSNGFDFSPSPYYVLNANTPVQGYGIASNMPSVSTASQISSFGNAPQSTGFFDTVGNFFKGVGNGIADTASGIADKVNGWYTRNFEYPALANRPYSILNGPNPYASMANPSTLSYAGSVDRQIASLNAPAEYQVSYKDYLDWLDKRYSSDYSPETTSDDTGLFGWSNKTWDNINTGLKIGQLGWNMYSGWKELQLAEDALAEERATNAYNRSLSTFNTNTQIEQANQSLRDMLYARQKFQTGSTEGAEQLYKDRELQKFRG